ncbi:MAG TPA: hypothetical protein VFG69_00040, partial [Nannocystaceae bacterium]|nr:hypothetical protein [Nannocystaceae bacterium]
LYDRPIDEEEALFAAIEPIGTFGPYTLARFLPAPAPFAELLGDSGTVEIVDRTATDVRFHVEPVGPTRLTVAWSPSHRWVWTVDGEPREHAYVSVRGGLDLLAVEIDGPADVELHYVHHGYERIATWVSWMAVLFAITGLALARPWSFAERLHSRAAIRTSRALAILTAVLALALVLRRQHTQLARTWNEYAEAITSDPSDPFPPFAGDLVNERAIEVTRTPDRICAGLLGKDPHVGCQESGGGPLVSMAYIDPYLYRCVQFSIIGGGQAEVVLPDGELLVGLVRRGDHRGRHLHYSIEAEGHTPRPRTMIAGADLRIRPSSDGAAPRIVLTNDGHDTERVCVAAARFER